MRSLLRTALVASILIFSASGHTQEAAAAAQGCTGDDLDALWIMTFQRASKSEICIAVIGKKGKVQSFTPCFVEQSGVAPYDLGGKLKIDKTCHVTGTFAPSVGSQLTVILRLVGGKMLMTGILIDDQNNYLPATLTRFDKL